MRQAPYLSEWLAWGSAQVPPAELAGRCICIPPAIPVAGPPGELSALCRAYPRERDPRVKKRMEIILGRSDGLPAGESIRALRVSRTTSAKWVRRFNAEGMRGLSDRPRPGRPPHYPRARVESVLASPPSAEGLKQQGWTPTLLWRVLEQHHSICYSRGHVAALCRQLDYQLIVPSTCSTKADPAAQARWREREGARLLAEHFETLWVEDETTARVATIPRRVLAKKGARPVIKVRVGAYSERVNVFTSWRAKTGRVVVTLANSLSPAPVRRHLGKLKRVRGKGRVDVLWDNHGSHKARKVRVAAAKIGIHLHNFPPYSPQMNPVEEINRQLKQHLATKLFTSREELVAEIKAFFRENRYRFKLDLARYFERQGR